MARTVFALARDGEKGNVFPIEEASEDRVGQSINRYENSELLGEEGRYTYPSSDGNDYYATPVIQFQILDAYSTRITNAPRLYIKAPPTLNLTSLNAYEQGGPIFGTGGSGALDKVLELMGNEYAKEAASKGEAAGEFSASLAEALEYSLRKGASGIAGFTSSLGLNGQSQYEFMSRRAINPMQQQLFKGPQFRRYQFPFMMKPRNEGEARNIKNIINTLRLASSASVPNQTDEISAFEGIDFSFGYPHLLQFSIQDKIGGDDLYVSKPCVIESVNVDYGSQKLVFHKDNYPAESNLSLGLIEITPRTLGDAIGDVTDSKRTLI